MSARARRKTASGRENTRVSGAGAVEGAARTVALLDLRPCEGGLTLRVRAQPRASHDGIAGLRDGAVLVRLTAPPVDGAANVALCRLLARTLGCPPSAVTLLQGSKGRDKLVRIAGLGRDDVRRALQPLLASPDVG